MVRRTAPRLLTAAVLTLVAALPGLLAPQPAYAHGQLAVATPADGGTLAEPVDAVSLAFTEQPVPFAYFTVTAPNGARVDRRWSTAGSLRLEEPVREYHRVDGVWEPRLYHVGYSVKVPVAYWPDQGGYVVRYQTVASDGEEVRGQVRFTYTGVTTPAPAGWQAPTDPPSPELLAAAGQERPAVEPSAPASGAATTGSAAAPPDEGIDTSVWLVPLLLIVGAAVLILRVARRPAPVAKSARRPAPANRRKQR
ncbi:copper resistance CopC family protein [Plantactinospora sp. WMMC1484]|uniref:copper resistance CopC family protein n=1 Tax=Plantactinospora sp. WMMC1484 TaxID=3404122 RepID=UPI003BF5EF71